MAEPMSLAERRILIAHDERFVAGYVARVLSMHGANVLATVYSIEDLRTQLAKAGGLAADALIGGLLYDLGSVAPFGSPVNLGALLFIGTRELPQHGPPCAALTYPFASFQVLDLLADLFARTVKEQPPRMLTAEG